MIIEAYIGLAILSLILFALSFSNKASNIVPILAVVFMLMTSIASFDIEKSYLTNEAYVCNTITEYATTNTSHCVDYIITNTYTTSTYQTSSPLAVIFAFFGFITLIMVFTKAFDDFRSIER